MKFKSFILAVLFLAGFATMEAQVSKKGKSGVNARADRQTEQMASQLSLSAEQKAKVKVVNEKYAQKMQDLRASTEDRTQLRPEMQKLRQEQEAEISKYLTKEQTDKWTKVQDERKGRREQMKKERAERPTKVSPAEGKAQASPRAKQKGNSASAKKMTAEQKAAKRSEKMEQELELSEAQTAKVNAIYTDYAAKKAALRGSKSPEDRAKMKELRGEEAKAIEGVLTKEQLEKRKALKAENRAKRAEQKQKMRSATKSESGQN